LPIIWSNHFILFIITSCFASFTSFYSLHPHKIIFCVINFYIQHIINGTRLCIPIPIPTFKIHYGPKHIYLCICFVIEDEHSTCVGSGVYSLFQNINISSYLLGHQHVFWRIELIVLHQAVYCLLFTILRPFGIRESIRWKANHGGQIVFWYWQHATNLAKAIVFIVCMNSTRVLVWVKGRAKQKHFLTYCVFGQTRSKCSSSSTFPKSQPWQSLFVYGTPFHAPNITSSCVLPHQNRAKVFRSWTQLMSHK
jgi:hypothetical protein